MVYTNYLDMDNFFVWLAAITAKKYINKTDTNN